MAGSPASAQSLPTAAENLTPGDLDSEQLFGFTEGSDLGGPDEAELEWETIGEAVYLGPTLCATLSLRAWASFTWSVQVAGKSVDTPGPLDPTSFDRHQMRPPVGYGFRRRMRAAPRLASRFPLPSKKISRSVTA